MNFKTDIALLTATIAEMGNLAVQRDAVKTGTKTKTATLHRLGFIAAFHREVDDIRSAVSNMDGWDNSKGAFSGGTWLHDYLKGGGQVYQDKGKKARKVWMIGERVVERITRDHIIAIVQSVAATDTSLASFVKRGRECAKEIGTRETNNANAQIDALAAFLASPECPAELASEDAYSLRDSLSASDPVKLATYEMQGRALHAAKVEADKRAADDKAQADRAFSLAQSILVMSAEDFALIVEAVQDRQARETALALAQADETFAASEGMQQAA